MSLKASEQKESSKSQVKKALEVKTKSGAEGKSCRFESKELPSRTPLPSDKSWSHWNKLKALRLQNNGSGFESMRKLSPEEKTVCKNSKLFSKTMPSVDALSSAKKASVSSTPGVSRESTLESRPKNMTVTASPNGIGPKWATSQSAVTPPAAKQSEWKLLKSKLNLLRRKGNRDFENCVETAIIGKETKEATVRPISGKHERSAQISLIRSSIPPTESILCKRSAEEKGIICKKEDLMHIISEASKGTKLTKNKSLTEEDDALASGASTSTGSTSGGAVSGVSGTAVTDVSIRRTALKKQHSCSAIESSSAEENKSIQSNTRTECLDSCGPENAYKNQYQSKTNTNTTKTIDESVSGNSLNSNSNCDSNDSNESNECQSRLRPNKVNNKSKSAKSVKSVKSEPINECNESNSSDSETDSQTESSQNTHNSHNERHNDHCNETNESNESNESNECESNVPGLQWDEGIDFVDPMLLGDAIQTFLQGLTSAGVGVGVGALSGSASASSKATAATHTTTNEKRVSFKKNS